MIFGTVHDGTLAFLSLKSTNVAQHVEATLAFTLHKSIRHYLIHRHIVDHQIIRPIGVRIGGIGLHTVVHHQ